MNILGIIPARGGSVGIPNKNIRSLNNKPLIQYTSDLALRSKYLKKIIVSTDSREIANISKNIGLEVPFIRPKSLAKNETPTVDVIKHALEFYISKKINFDAVCILQVTSPLRTLKFLDLCLKSFIEKNSDSLVSVKLVPDHFNPHWCFEADKDGFLKISTGDQDIIPRRQELPRTYYRDGSIYITKSKIVLDESSLFGKKISFKINPVKANLNIDSLDDWKKAEKIFRNKKIDF